VRGKGSTSNRRGLVGHTISGPFAFLLESSGPTNSLTFSSHTVSQILWLLSHTWVSWRYWIMKLAIGRFVDAEHSRPFLCWGLSEITGSSAIYDWPGGVEIGKLDPGTT